jgi:hypothetical protein
MDLLDNEFEIGTEDDIEVQKTRLLSQAGYLWVPQKVKPGRCSGLKSFLLLQRSIMGQCRQDAVFSPSLASLFPVFLLWQALLSMTEWSTTSV